MFYIKNYFRKKLIHELDLLGEILRLRDINQWNREAIKMLCVSYALTIVSGLGAIILFYKINYSWMVPIITILVSLELYNYLRKHSVSATFGRPLDVESLGTFNGGFPPIRKVHLFQGLLPTSLKDRQRYVFSELHGSRLSYIKNKNYLVLKHDFHDRWVVPLTKEYVSALCLDADRKDRLVEFFKIDNDRTQSYKYILR